MVSILEKQCRNNRRIELQPGHCSMIKHMLCVFEIIGKKSCIHKNAKKNKY